MNLEESTLRLLDGFTPQIKTLFTLLHVSKETILNRLVRLDTGQLDFFPDGGNSIGTLLRHMAALEYKYQALTFEARDLNDQERKFWRGSLPDQLMLKLVTGNAFAYYQSLWDNVRENTYLLLREKTDDWLFQPSASPLQFNNYYCWYHVLEDHLCHYGQIKLILKKIP